VAGPRDHHRSLPEVRRALPGASSEAGARSHEPNAVDEPRPRRQRIGPDHPARGQPALAFRGVGLDADGPLGLVDLPLPVGGSQDHFCVPAPPRMPSYWQRRHHQRFAPEGDDDFGAERGGAAGGPRSWFLRARPVSHQGRAARGSAGTRGHGNIDREDGDEAASEQLGGSSRGEER
jgi:hypothetical protein